MENIRVLRMAKTDNEYGTFVYDINHMVFTLGDFIDHLMVPHTDNYEMRTMWYEEMRCVFPEASQEKIDNIWDILTSMEEYSVISNDPDKFERYRLTIFNKIWEWCA